MTTEAQRWWAENQHQSVKSYEEIEPWRIELCGYVAASWPGNDTAHPRSVLEFGCGVGNNLEVLKRWEPPIPSVVGMDVSKSAVDRAVKAGRQAMCGTERDLEGMLAVNGGPIRDVVFTSSVLDHIPDAYRVFRRLRDLASRRVVLLEPWIEGMPEGLAPKGLTQTPWTYLWQYQDWADWTKVKPMPLPSHPTKLGAHYHLWVLEKE